MDLKIVLFNMFFMVVFILPFVILGWFQQKRKQILGRIITQLSASHQCTLANKEFCGELVIGLDTQMRYLFFAKRLGLRNNQEIKHVIDLKGLQYCKSIRQITPKNNTTGKQEVIETLELAFFDGISASPKVCIEFFNKENSLQLSGEYALLEKWENKLNTIFSQRSKS